VKRHLPYAIKQVSMLQPGWLVLDLPIPEGGGRGVQLLLFCPAIMQRVSGTV